MGLKKYQHICGRHKLCNPMMINEKHEKFIEYKHFTRSNRIPIIIIADFECFLKNIFNFIKTNITITHKYKPMSHGSYVQIYYNKIPLKIIK